MKNVCLALLCWLSLRFLLLSMFLPILAEAVLQDSVLQSSIGLPVRRIWAAILLLPLLMPFFGGGAAEDSSSSAALSASSSDARRAEVNQRVRCHRASVDPSSQVPALPSRRTRPPESQAPPAAQSLHLPQADSSSSSAALSASSSDARRAEVNQRVRCHRASVDPSSQVPALPSRRTRPPESQAPPAAQSLHLPQAGSSSSSAALSASSAEARRAAESQRQRDHRVAQQAHHDAAREPAPAIEAEIMSSYRFTEAELAYAADNFERSPVAALAFSVANTGIANTPEDLGPLLDGPPNPAASMLAFKRRTETPLHACACCGMRTYDCTRMLRRALDLHIMSAVEVLEFDALSEVLQQVKSTCVIDGRRYMLHPELVHASSGNADTAIQFPLPHSKFGR